MAGKKPFLSDERQLVTTVFIDKHKIKMAGSNGIVYIRGK